MSKIRLVFRVEKGWVNEYQRVSKLGREHRVSGYWRNENPQIPNDTWKDYGLLEWANVVKKFKPKLIKPIEDVDELQSVLIGLKSVFSPNKDGWATIPTWYGDMRVGIEPGYYGHVGRAEGRIEADNRIRYFRAVVDVLVRPTEVWRQPVGKNATDGLIFMAPYHFLGEKDKAVVVLVGFRDNKPVIWTTIPMSKWRDVDKKRHGELLLQDYRDRE